MPYNIAIGGIRQETNTFSPLPTVSSDFRIVNDKILLKSLNFNQPDIVLKPMFVAVAMPGGLVQEETYLELKTNLLHELEATLPIDGVYLDLHGAMEVENIGDAEGDLLGSVRELAGPDVLISVSLDLHANVSPALVENANMITAFRTAPHRDYQETRQRALTLLVEALRRRLKPVSVLLKPPLLLTGEEAVTDREPAKSLYAQLPDIDNIPGIMSTSILIGCAWTDSVYTSTSIVVTAEEDTILVQNEAAKLARQLWEQRDQFNFGVETTSVDEAISQAMVSQQTPVFISDSGDNVTAGAPGDVPIFAERLLALQATDAVVAGLCDAEAVQICANAGKGAVVSLSVGGKIDQRNSEPLSVTGHVQNIVFADGTTNVPIIAVVQVNGVTLILTRDRRAFTTRDAILEAGIDPMQQRLVVVKQGYLFPDLADQAPRAIMALSRGASSLDKSTLPYQHLPRPIYPLDAVSWDVADDKIAK